MGRVAPSASGLGALFGVVAFFVALGATADPPGEGAQEDEAKETLRMRLFADTDDDDDDGRDDRAGTPPDRADDVRWIEPAHAEESMLQVSGTGVRVIADSHVVTPGDLSAGLKWTRLGLQGIEPGRAVIDLGSRRIDAGVCEFMAFDPSGHRVDLATSHASISRTLPPSLAKEADGSEEIDALSWTVVCPKGLVPSFVKVESRRPGGEPLDMIAELSIDSVTCPRSIAKQFECGATGPIRATTDEIDRRHPAASARSLKAEVGGRIVLEVEGRKASSIRVGGPRETALGSVGRFRAKLRFSVTRLDRGGAAAVGGNSAGAYAIVKREAETASALWGQCGIVFDESDLQVRLVDPPPPHLLAIGCEVGMPASGGTIRFRAGTRPVSVRIEARQSPLQVAEAVARAVEKAGFGAEVSPNPRTEVGALPTVDVMVRDATGRLASLSRDGDQPLSDDDTLAVCIGEVDLSDGLSHFNDLDAVAGTVEERALLKPLIDDDPSTIDVVVVPSFSRTGRIGESFIDADESSIRNVVVIDRAGIRAGARSFALAHELGHILLDMPGHPDDYGVDRPWALMDADAADPTIFGPRRLRVFECERALRQSGPEAPIPLLTPWPLYGDAHRAGNPER